MKELVEKIKTLLISIKLMPINFRRKSRAQSMVEFALLLPLLLLLLLVMVEYGFMLNTYLSLQDATRQAARVFSNQTPFKIIDVSGVKTQVDDLTFYSKVAYAVIDTLNANSYQIEFDTASGSPDNVLVSVVGVDIGAAPNPSTIKYLRHPDGSNYFSLNLTNGQESKFEDNAKIEEYITRGGAPVDAGLLIIELYYGYEGTIQVPNWWDWVIFATDDNPIVLYAYTIMPLGSVKPLRPTPTPPPP